MRTYEHTFHYFSFIFILYFSSCFVHDLDKFFYYHQFYVQWWQQNLNGFNEWWMLNVFLPRNQRLTERKVFFDWRRGSLLLGYSIHRENNSYKLVADPSLKLLPSSHHTVAAVVSHKLIHLKRCFLLSYVSFTWKAQLTGIDDKIFPLCSKTALKLFLDESVISLH